MDATEFTEVCRLCPTTGVNQSLLYVFDKNIPFRYNITEVISITTGIEILETDLVSKKICQRCCNILLRMFEFRLDALKQDKKLKEKCSQLLIDKGIILPTTCGTINKEKFELVLAQKEPETEPETKSSSTGNGGLKAQIHSSVKEIYNHYPHLKLSKKLFERDMAPVVSLTMGEVETYFRKRKLDMRKFIYRDKSLKKKCNPPPEEKKVVSPLKISKTLLKAHENSEFGSDFRLKIPKHSKGRKRIISSSDSNRSESSKCSRSVEYKSDSNLTDTIKATTSTTKELSFSLSDTILNPNDECSSTSLIIAKRRTPSPTSANHLPDKNIPSLPTPTELMSENSRDSFSTNASKTSTSNEYGKPEYIESLGLTPTVTQTKSHKLLTCCLCGSFHHNAFELKKHTKKHMVCQFCKLKFKSVEAKVKHVDEQCQVKKMMNSSEPIVSLEKIHLNLNVRKKYKNAFTSFELVPELVEPSPLEHIDLKPTSPLSLDADDIIVLSDEDDETSTRSIDPLSGISTLLANMPSPAVENIVYSTVSIVRPDIRIKNNTVLNYLMENMTDGDLVKHFIETFKPEKTTAEKILQTDLPASEDIRINNLEGTCEFKKLKTQLLTYKIPVYLSNGSFNASYKCKDNKKTHKSLALWNDLPVIDVCNKTDTARLSNNIITPLSANPSSLPGPSQPKSSTVTITSLPVITHVTSAPLITNVSIVPIMTLSPATTFTTSTSTNNSLLLPTQNPLLMNILDRNNSLPQNFSTPLTPMIGSNSATPLLQNYALSITPQITHNPIPIPRTYINSALNYTASVSNRTISLANSTTFGSKPVYSSLSQSHSANNFAPITTVISNSPGTLMGSVLTTQNPQNGNITSPNMSLLKPSTSGTAVQLTNNLSASITEKKSSVSSSVPQPSGFRVKSVWELQ